MIGLVHKLDLTKKIVLAIVAFLLIGLGFGFWYVNANKEHEEEHVHVHAGFKVLVEDEEVDFTGSEYMYFLPCGMDAAEHKTLNDKVHLHDNVGDVVHVHAKGITWGDLFESIKFEFPEGEMKFIKDGAEVGSLLNEEIQNMESVVFVVDGEEEIEEYIDEQVSAERIDEISHSKENCGV